jgi:hypothetical protein
MPNHLGRDVDEDIAEAPARAKPSRPTGTSRNTPKPGLRTGQQDGSYGPFGTNKDKNLIKSKQKAQPESKWDTISLLFVLCCVLGPGVCAAMTTLSSIIAGLQAFQVMMTIGFLAFLMWARRSFLSHG